MIEDESDFIFDKPLTILSGLHVVGPRVFHNLISQLTPEEEDCAR
jgi:hypothetical protein